MAEILAFGCLLAIIFCLMLGYPVAFVLAGVSLAFAVLGELLGVFDFSYIASFPNRIYGVMTNDVLIAVPLFIFMGITLEKSKIAEELLEMMSSLMSEMRSGLGVAVMLVGALLAASTGIVGATVVTMGLISLPTMLKNKYSPELSTGTICAAGTLGQIIPPSIVLILMGDQISSAFQTVQMKQGNFSASPVSVADLFMGAVIPGLALVGLYLIWIIYKGEKSVKPKTHESFGHVLKVLLPPLSLILVVLGSIMAGIATPTESAAIGALGALIIAAGHKRLSISMIRDVSRETSLVSCMIFSILIGAAMFSLVFRGMGGDDMVHEFLTSLPGGLFGAMMITMLIMFLLGFFLDFIEIIYVVVPIVAPILLMMGADPIWLAIMIAINLQTSFLTPPFGFALFYLRGVAPKSVETTQIYRGVAPFVGIQILMLVLLALFPELATWLPNELYGSSETNLEAPLELDRAFSIDW